MILGLDVSHFQGAPNFAAAKAAGRSFVVLKATEGIGYVDPSFAANRKAAHAAGLIVGIYHFGRDNAPAAEAAYFAGVVGALQPGEFLVLDQEVTHAGGNVPWCAAWLDATRSHYGIPPLIYMNKGSSTGLASGNWTQIAQAYGLWAAIYDNSTTQPTVPYWGAPAMKQYSDAGTVLGVSGTCDVDVFYGSAAQLAAYGKPQPTPGGVTDMTPAEHDLLQQVWDAIFAGGARTPAGQPLANLIGDIHGKVVDSNFDLTGRPGPDKDDLFGQVLSTRAEVRQLAGHATPTVDPKALADALVADTQAVATLADALAAAIAKRLGNG